MCSSVRSDSVNQLIELLHVDSGVCTLPREASQQGCGIGSTSAKFSQMYQPSLASQLTPSANLHEGVSLRNCPSPSLLIDVGLGGKLVEESMFGARQFVNHPVAAPSDFFVVDEAIVSKRIEHLPNLVFADIDEFVFDNRARRYGSVVRGDPQHNADVERMTVTASAHSIRFVFRVLASSVPQSGADD